MTAALGAALLATTMLVAVGTVAPPAANALSGSSFSPGNIISDSTFFNSGSMNSDGVQSFLNGKVASCAASNGQPCLRNYSQSTPTLPANSYCRAYSGSASESAAQLITKVSLACGINPQVLLVMLEKEQGLVSSSSPTATMYNAALGFLCTDSAPCDPAYAGFFNQVYSAARQFQSYTQNSSSWAYQPGRINNILYNPNTACGSSPVYIQNQATANLYIYTPYQPNAAALANLYGTGDGCSAYGNRNFWVLFSSWFGDPTGGGLRSPGFEGGTSDGWFSSNGDLNRAVYRDPATAQSGSYYMATNTAVPGRANSQDVARQVSVGDQVTVSVWLRSAFSMPFSGAVTVWGLGGQTEAAQTPFTVTDTWQQVTVKLPVRQSAHSTIRLDIYLYSTAGTLDIDSASMAFGLAPPVQNLLSYPSFEGGQWGLWQAGNGFLNRAFYKDSSVAESGDYYAASNTAVPGRSLAQQINVSVAVGERYSFSMWLKSSDPNTPISGSLALWGLGSHYSAAQTPYTVGSSWQKVTVSYDITDASVTQLKPEIYLSTTNTTLYLDNGILSRNIAPSGGFENNSASGWGPGNGTVNFVVYNSAQTGVASKFGSYFAATNTQAPGSSLALTVARQTTVGDDFTGEVWLRSADPAKTFSGTLALWGLGGATEGASVPFTVGADWTLVRVDLPIGKPDHTDLKLEIYESSTNNTLFVDGAQIY
ncbi:carbohydrate binding domain-containing protein [Subtercola sp. PAMC28395]|uniref:carbohydrate binding domain-containing protein n=1 Tax=Subtercola sp. PAMC28395 TaxID=2846775 RepID=UPI001C0E4726|nr:carbohydrate binding domain-containing protein [Subtercola sp. PAMC28395]QWT25028.1 carbohydrate binding domain-containing protein [Subtercola sp. PAMC28395]